MRLDTAVVCVLRRFFSASDTFQWEPYLRHRNSYGCKGYRISRYLPLVKASGHSEVADIFRELARPSNNVNVTRTDRYLVTITILCASDVFGLRVCRSPCSPSGAKATALVGAPHPLHIVLRLPVQPRGCRLCIAERRVSFATRCGHSQGTGEYALLARAVLTQGQVQQQAEGMGGAWGARTCEEEGVVGVPGRVLLGLEQRVKVPEAARQHRHPHPHSIWRKQSGACIISIVGLPSSELWRDEQLMVGTTGSCLTCSQHSCLWASLRTPCL